MKTQDLKKCGNRFYYSKENRICGCIHEGVKIDLIRVSKPGFKEYLAPGMYIDFILISNY